MCYSTPMSFSFAFVGILSAIYLILYNNLKYNYLPLLLLFYSFMEILQGVQYYYVNQCKNKINIFLTEIAYILVILQPFMWNFFYYNNTVGCDKKYFVIGMILSVCWSITSILTRIFYTKDNGIKYEQSVYANETSCTKKDKGHLYWQWSSANFFDLNPGMLMYLLIWMVPALISRQHRSISIILLLSLFVSLLFSYYNNEVTTITSLWCYVSVPIVLIVIINIIMKVKYKHLR